MCHITNIFPNVDKLHVAFKVNEPLALSNVRVKSPIEALCGEGRLRSRMDT